MSITGLMRLLSLIGIDAIWQLSLGCLLMRTIASLLRYTVYLNFINGPISRVLLLILVHVQLLSCLFLWLLASLRLKTMSLNIARQFMKEMVKKYFVLLKIQVKFLIDKSRGFLASGLSTYHFTTLYTTLPHNLIKGKLTELIKQTLYKEGSLYLACNDKNTFFTSEQLKRYKLCHVRKCVILSIIVRTIYL